jgi:hypothetical protein
VYAGAGNATGSGFSNTHATAQLAAARHEPIDLLDEVLHRRGADELAVIASFLGDIVERHEREMAEQD